MIKPQTQRELVLWNEIETLWDEIETLRNELKDR